MNLNIKEIKLEQQGGDVFLLNQVLSAFGLSVSSKEVINGVAGKDTQKKVALLQQQLHISPPNNVPLLDDKTIAILGKAMVDNGMISSSTSFTASGNVKSANGKIKKQQQLIAYDLDLKGVGVYRDLKNLDEILKNNTKGGFDYLGEAVTDSKGNYSFTFFEFQYQRSEGGIGDKADIVVFAVDKEKIVGRSQLINLENYDQKGFVRGVDIVIDEKKDERTEYKILKETLDPFLKENKVSSLAEIAKSSDQLAFTASELDLDLSHLTILASAELLIEQEGEFEKMRELLYGLGRQDIELSWSILFKKHRDELQAAIGYLADSNIIAKPTDRNVAIFLDAIQKHSVQHVLDDKSGDDDNQLNLLLKTALPKEPQRVAFLKAVNEFEGSDFPKFWKDLHEKPEFKNKPELVSGIQLTQQLHALTNFQPLVEELQKTRGIQSIEKLIDLDKADWGRAITVAGIPDFVEGKDDKEKRENYVGALENQLNAAFPTQRIAKMIRDKELVFEKVEVKDHLGEFLKVHKDFDFKTTQIHKYIEENKASMEPSTLDAVSKELMELQRLFQVSTSPTVLKVLRENKLTSAYAIANIPRDNFISTYEEVLGGTDIAIAVHNRGESLAKRAENNAMMINEASADSPEKIMSGAMKKEVEEFFEEKLPNYKNLFGSPDLCECQHCRSVFSPAAYLVELLRFLEKSTYTFKKEGGVEETHSPYEYLVGKPDVNPDINIAGRRPDLAKLELSCDNTNTLIPYIDLSNEVMESYIAAGSLEEYDENIRDVTADELRANPQHTNTQAYRILSNNDPSKTANYPFNLPFHQPLNVIRTYSDFLNTSRYEIMQAVNPEPNDISKKAIAAEALGFSEEEYRLLVGMNFNGNPVTTEAFEYFGYENVEELEELSPVQVFMNRIGTTYVELVELVKTRFINPHQYLLDYIEEHFSGTAIDGDILYGWLAKAAAGTNTPADDATLTAEDGSNLATPELVQWAQNNFAEFQQIITLFEPKSACNLDTTSLRTILAVYEKTESVDINGNIVSEITAEVWSRFHYFIRLWNKLSWSIHEVDLMLASLEQNEITFDTISKLESVVSLKKASNLPLNKLATLWGNIDTYGEESLYKQLFLNKAVQEIDKVFIADAQGNYLQEPLTKSLSEHQSTILAVFRISAEELNTILATASRNYNEVNPDENDRLTLEDKLSLENLSTIYRYVVLANAMKLSVTELCKLIELFDSKIKDDQLFSSPQKTIEFFKLVISTKEAGFKPALLDYIFTGSSPSDSTIGLDQNKTQQLATGIRDGFHAIEQSYPQEPEILNSEIVAATLSVSFKENAVSRLVSIVEGTVKFEALVANTNLDVKISNELANKYAYVKKTGLLSCLGVMSEAEKTALKALTNTTEIFNAVVDDLYAAPEIFISDNFSGILGDSDSFNQIILERPVQDPAILLDEKLEYIYSKFIPLIKNKLKREVITKNISDLIEQSEVSTGLLIENDIDELIENISKQGFSTSYFNNVDWSGDSVPVSENEMVNKELDISWIKSPVDERSIPQQVNDSFSVKWEAYIKAPASEFYTFLVDVEESDEVFNLYLDNVLILTKDALSDDVSFKTTDAINLDATQLYSLTLEYAEKSGSAGVRLRWKTATSTPEIIPASVAYPVHILDNFVQQVNTLHRAAAFIDRFDISEVELKHFITFKEDFGNIDFNSIEAKHFKRIFDYTKLRDSIPQNQAFLTEVFALANQIELMPEMESLKEIVLQATNWNSADLDFLVHLSQLNLDIGDFKNEIALNQILKIMTITTKTGLSAETISNSGKVETDFENLDDTAQILKNAVKAKYSNTEWLEVAGGLSDKIREQQKQALISYLLVQDTIKAARVKDADGLFEHLLIDVQMGACMDTSRIVQANAAIQLFVNRILLNLEDHIPPDAIDTQQWEWIKNYRVWEANRKVFLYPENWLEPEWRNDRSEFFKDLESHLLQNDITERSVEQGLRNYLMSMNEVSNLDVCGMHQENDDDDELKFLHVFGRTHNLPYKYFYRRWNEYEKWSAWEKVSVDIQGVEDGENSGVHLIPVVWKGRLFLFWPEFMEMSKEPDGLEGQTMTQLGGGEDGGSKKTTLDDLKPIKSWEIRLGWTEYVDGTWSSKQVSKEYIEISNWGPKNSQVQPANVRIRPHFDDDSNLVIIVDAFSKEWRSAFVFSDLHSPLMIRQCKSVNGGKPIKDKVNFFTKEKYQNMMLNFPPDDNTYLKNKKNYNLIKENSTTSLTPFFYIEGRNNYFITQYLARQWGIGLDKVLDPSDMVIARVIDDETTGGGIPSTMLLKKIKHDWHTGNPILIAKPTDPPDSADPEPDRVVPCLYGHVNVLKMHVKGATLTFHTFYHPFASKFATRLNQDGVSALMGSDTEDLVETNDQFDDVITPDGGEKFKEYSPNFDQGLVKPHITYYENPTNKRTYYQENVCFDVYGANSLYNWELFFHAPLYIATRLSKNGKYKEAMQWFHYIFDPTTNEKSKNNDDTARYWKVKPFKVESEKIETLESWFKKLQPNSDPENKGNMDIDEWRKNPFEPHLVANNRPIAYMKHVVIKYIENLMDWGDSLFRQFTRESVYEAIQLYIIASHVLGKRPEKVPKRGKIKTETYVNLRKSFDDFGNALVELENLFPYSGGVNNTPVSTTTNILGIGEALYFCIPANDKLLEYWDTVADRLFKIRHCQDFDGVERSLALFSPEIDPEDLIKARSQGLSLGSILADLSSPPPLYRFNYLLQKANEFCGDVKALGSALLSAIEKKDAEELGRLRASQEIGLLEQVTAIRERQVLSARSNKDNLSKLRETAKFRLQHYKDLLGDDSGEPADADSLDSTLTANSQLPVDTNIPLIETGVDMSLVDSEENSVKIIPREKQQLEKNDNAKKINALANGAETLAGIVALIPAISGYGAPLGVGIETKSPNWASSIHLGANAARSYSSFLSAEASQTSILASYLRRTYDWSLQANLVIREIFSLDKQCTSADIQIQIAEKELKNHKQQIKNSQQVEEFLKSKFSNQELYQWMKEQISSVYKQSYNLAYEMAKKAEKAYQRELGIETSSFVQYGYWDNANQGLVSGEKLQLALRQLENSFLNNNRRKYELTKHISLSMLDPLALVTLRATGVCDFNIPEALYDMDHAGQYFRRIKSVSISMPCITGPYTSVSAKLSLVSNKYRKNTEVATGYAEVDNDTRFTHNIGAIQSISTSSAQNDSGVFELNFRDERYLPFEGAGATSSWRLELPKEVRQFDYETISDVVLHVKYTAREGGSALKEAAEGTLNDTLKNIGQALEETGLHMAINMKHDMSTAWHLLVNEGKVDVNIDDSRLPYFVQSLNASIEKVIFIAKLEELEDTPLDYRLEIKLNETTLEKNDDLGLYKGEIDTISLDKAFEISGDTSKLEELVMVVKYKFS